MNEEYSFVSHFWFPARSLLPGIGYWTDWGTKPAAGYRPSARIDQLYLAQYRPTTPTFRSTRKGYFIGYVDLWLN
jgi:hypothetical protein